MKNDDDLRCCVARLSLVIADIAAWNTDFGHDNIMDMLDRIDKALLFIDSSIKKEVAELKKQD